MKSTRSRNKSLGRRLALGVAAFLVGAVLSTASLHAQVNGEGLTPYLGWSTFSEQSVSPGFLTQANVQAQSDALKASELQQHGFVYINIDSGWQGSFDGNGRPIPNTTTFPDIQGLIAHIHANGQKVGIYWIPGIELPAIQGNYPILGTSYHTPDIAVTPHAPGNAFGATSGEPYHDKIDFTKPGAQEYINSIVALWSSWGVDFIKLDAVTPGSDNNSTSIDNRPDVAAYSKAIANSGRPMWLTVSWAMDQDYQSTWQQYANARRIDEDVECEGSCGPSLTNWPRILLRAYDDVAWEHSAGPTLGWNDLDSLDVVGASGTTTVATGLTNDEKMSATNIWLMANSPIYLGGDLTKLDSFATSAFTNDELLAVNQSGSPAVQMTGGFHQVWMSNPGSGFVYVALYNFNAFPDRVDVRWSDLGFNNATAVRDLWSQTDLGAFPGSFSAMVAPHGSRLLKVTPNGAITPVTGGTVYEAEAAALSGGTQVASCSSCSGGSKVGYIGGNAIVTFNNVNVPTAGVYRMEIDGMTQGPRTLEYSVNGAPGGSLNMGGGSYVLPQSSTVNVALSAGNNTIVFNNPSGYGADLDRIVISGDGKEFANTFTVYEGEAAAQAGSAVGAYNYSTRASGGAYIGGMGNGAGNTVTFNNVSVPSTGTYQLELDYVVDGQRTFYVSVNGGTPTVLNLSGNSWYDPVPYTMSVQLNGGSPNTIVFSNPNSGAYAPGLDLIAVSGGGNTAPIISVPSGTYTSVQNVTITDTTPGATIYYTKDGSTPSSASTQYTGPVTVRSSETLKAIAIAPNFPDSNIASATYVVNLTNIAPPMFTPPAGTYVGPQQIVLSDAVNGATIHYTTDGSAPTATSPVYSAPIVVTANETINAYATGSGYPDSPVVSASYIITLPTAATPTFTPVAGTYTSVQSVAIADATTGATIYYTTDGSTPTVNSSVYSNPLTVGANETIKAIAVASGYLTSAVGSAAYTINLPPPSIALSLNVPTMVISRGKSGTVTLTVTGQNGFSGTVNLACSGLPSGVSCSFNPSTLNISGSTAGTTTLTVTASNTVTASMAIIPAIFGLGFFAFNARRRRMVNLLAVLCLAALGFTMLSGCGGAAQPPVTTQATITVTSGAVTQKAPLLVTVQ
ncbi:chitobiase/beta-hexosaminidase C-terminal domain-containing protein [Edaphobacter bradus]|uniref:chitobiase/beta-hexosaminidase C-terminal domain-containing protein n=1 Tax=Edaphobacter bradus TaxID=2259016 RepID=UPI0021E01A7F|nr:chitobiase/beta-hexosaminidase C-terminal domain-containing protein [Edaphobacter bradus]